MLHAFGGGLNANLWKLCSSSAAAIVVLGVFGRLIVTGDRISAAEATARS